MSAFNASQAQSEYYRRPKDERFESLTALVDHATYQRSITREKMYNLKDLKAITAVETEGKPESLMIESPRGRATLSHYAFGQLCQDINAPARYMRSLPPALLAQNLNHGIMDSAVGTQVNLLVKQNGGPPLIRACTSASYGRVWGADLFSEVAYHFGDGKVSAGGTWQTPPAWPGSLPSGNYDGDRDSFVIRCDGGSIVEDPSASQGNGQLFRGILIRNSEVGHCAATLEAIFYRYICGNHMLWGAVMDSRFRRRHIGKNVTRDVMRELASIAWKFNSRAASEDERIIRALISHEIALTKDAVVDELRKMGASKEQAMLAYDTCERTESVSPRSFWGLAQGMTRASQESGYQDDRLGMDLLAGEIMRRGALLAV